MRQYEEIQSTTLTEIACNCNRCGKAHSPAQSNNVVPISAEFVDYGTTYENQKWYFDLCGDCLVETFKTFKIVPEGFMQDYTETSFIKDAQVVFEHWKATGEWETYLGYTYDELVSLQDDYYHNAEDVNELILKYYPDQKLIKGE